MTSTEERFSAGLCSVTLRHLPVRQVVDVAAAAGLSCVEWGGDRHVPPGNTRAAALARQVGLDQGIRVASYGSYFRAGPDGADGFAAVLASAVALGAPRIRIWAGDVASAAATAQHRRAVVDVARSVAEQASDAGVRVAFEYHGGSLTDTADSAARLLQDVDHPAMGTYWQPPVAAPDAAALDGLERVLPWVAAVHVFSWWPGERRLPLDARAPLWRAVFDALHRTGRRYDTLLEFVRDDDPAHIVADGATLVRLLSGPTTGAGADVDR
jgi:3-dehydroshikimate dehydratase